MANLLLSRAAARTSGLCRPTLRAASVRFMGGSPLPVDVDHYTSGWNIEDIDEFTQPGKFNIRTYNKISPVVSTMVLSPNVGLIICRCFVHCHHLLLLIASPRKATPTCMSLLNLERCHVTARNLIQLDIMLDRPCTI